MMLRNTIAAGVVLATAAAAAMLAVRAQTRPAVASAPRLVPVAETRLLMEGLAQANFQGLERLLRQKPADLESWTFARGQALLIAETANLLMLRPPRNPGERAWLDRATELRKSASQLARSLASRDFEKSRKDLFTLANNCNACHQTFRVKTRIVPFREAEPQPED